MHQFNKINPNHACICLAYPVYVLSCYTVKFECKLRVLNNAVRSYADIVTRDICKYFF